MKSSYSTLDDFLEDVHSELSVKQLAMDMGVYTKDDFRGQLVCCCFHHEKTPSMQLGQAFFRCYSGACGARGDAIQFVQMYKNTGFMEAVKEIADLYGINISGLKVKFDGRVSQMKEEWERYQRDLETAPDAAKLMERTFFPQQIGYDRKIGFVVLPLTAKSGSVLGFTKRRVDELHVKDDEGKWDAPKWKHSNINDSLINQVHNVFNLASAASAIRMEKKVIVNEGPKDAIAWRRAGIEWTVGSCGTSNSGNIWEVILPVRDIYLSMDGDEAGIASNINNILDLAKIHDLNHVFVIPMPVGKDPYDVVTGQNGVKNLLKALNSPIPSIDFLITKGTLHDAIALYGNVPEYAKTSVLKSICKNKGFNVLEAESWLTSEEIGANIKTAGPNDAKQIDEKTELLKIINGEQSELNMDANKAARILSMKYGVKTGG